MSGSPKRLKTGAKIDYKKYEKGRKYNRDQEASPEFKDWICKSQRSEDEKAFCKWCKSEIAPNVAKLRVHTQTKKHSDLAKEKASQKSVKNLFQPVPNSVSQIRKRR